MNKKGFFITFEKTCDGLGGTTQAKRLYERLKTDGFDVVMTNEPGATRLGYFVRDMLLSPDVFFGEGYELSKEAELLLFNADRAEHFHKVIKPALDRGAIVISDRYFDSTLVYQGEGRGWKDEVLNFLHTIATNHLLPDTTIVLDGTPYIDLSEGDRFERSGKEFFVRVRRRMLQLANSSKRYFLLNANRDIEKNEQEIYDHVIKKMREVGYEGNMSVL